MFLKTSVPVRVGQFPEDARCTAAILQSSVRRWVGNPAEDLKNCLFEVNKDVPNKWFMVANAPNKQRKIVGALFFERGPSKIIPSMHLTSLMVDRCVPRRELSLVSASLIDAVTHAFDATWEGRGWITMNVETESVVFGDLLESLGWEVLTSDVKTTRFVRYGESTCRPVNPPNL